MFYFNSLNFKSDWFFKISVFLVSVLNVTKCLEIVENCFQGNLFTTNTDTKNTENSKKQSKHHKHLILACFSHFQVVRVKSILRIIIIF